MIINTLSTAEKAAYLAAFVDGEGHIGCHRNKRGTARVISVCNTDPDLIAAVVQICKDLGFDPTTQFREPEKPGWLPKTTILIATNRTAYQQFSDLIPIASGRKQAALADILASYLTKEEIAEHKRNGFSTPCETCGKPVYGTPAVRNRGGARFCGRTCFGLTTRNRTECQCEHCGKIFTIIKAREGRARFCSRSCQGKAQGARLATQAKMASNSRWKSKDH